MTDSIHVAAATGFEAGADAYERARPTYPPDAVAFIVETLDLRPGRTVLELGAGTGKLTRLLVPSGARILALEPVEAMRAKLVESVPGVELVDGTAEAIRLPNGSVDAVVVAQAFHWFDAIRALSEIHRVLRPGGRVVLAWNRRDEIGPVGEGAGRRDPPRLGRRATGGGRDLARVAGAVCAVRAVGHHELPARPATVTGRRAGPGGVGQLRGRGHAQGACLRAGRGVGDPPRRSRDGRPRRGRAPVRHRGPVVRAPVHRARRDRDRGVRQRQRRRRAEAAGGRRPGPAARSGRRCPPRA